MAVMVTRGVCAELEEPDAGTQSAKLEESDMRAVVLACDAHGPQNRFVYATAVVPQPYLLPKPKPASAVVTMTVDEHELDAPRVAIPRPEIQLVVRFGSIARNGLDVHAFGARETAHRKILRGGLRVVMARLRLGTTEAALGVPASQITGRVVELEGLWGDAAVRRLRDRLAATSTTIEAAAVLERAIAERVLVANHPRGGAQLALDAAERLSHDNVNIVADNLGVSERHLRRVFRETVGLSPKAYAKLTRFNRALHAARAEQRASWAMIAASSGYYDQAHLIAEFKAIAGVTPRALMDELRAGELGRRRSRIANAPAFVAV